MSTLSACLGGKATVTRQPATFATDKWPEQATVHHKKFAADKWPEQATAQNIRS